MSNQSETENDQAWEKLFRQYDILNHVQNDGSFVITSKQINQFREARLMTKFDHQSNLPVLFRKNALSILPVTRGSYIISHFDAYQDLRTGGDITRIGFPDHIQSLDYQDITSEAAAINCAHISGILADFVQDEQLLPTVSGRMSSGCFDFGIRNTTLNNFVNISVKNSQIEIDGGYEGLEFLTLVEAKNSISENFLIRQIYYPFRLWSSKIGKEVKLVFLVYTNGVFRLYEYRFDNPGNYNSLTLVKQKNYSIEPDDITLDDILRIMASAKTVDDPPIPFPQADSFERVINLCELLYENTELSREQVTSQYDFDARQTNYYTDAGRYLGLIDKKTENGIVCYFLTDRGNDLFKLGYKARQLGFAEIILEHSTFKQALHLYLSSAAPPSRLEIVDIMKSSNLYNIKSDNTFERRASTVRGWLDWILGLPG